MARGNDGSGGSSSRSSAGGWLQNMMSAVQRWATNTTLRNTQKVSQQYKPSYTAPTFRTPFIQQGPTDARQYQMRFRTLNSSNNPLRENVTGASYRMRYTGPGSMPLGTANSAGRPVTSNLPTEADYSDYGSYGGGGGGGWGGGGGGGETTPVPVTWSEFVSKVAGAPAWWKAMKPSAINEGDEDTQYIMALNMLIPFLSPEDQKTAAQTIYQINAKDFGHLNPEKIKVDAPKITPDIITKYTGSGRANQALAALSELAGVVGKQDSELSSGYRYLRSILDAVSQYGGKDDLNRQTRSQYQKMMAALDPLYGQTKSGTLSMYGSLARMLAQPFFSSGQLTPFQKAADGSYVFGAPNKSLM